MKRLSLIAALFLFQIINCYSQIDTIFIFDLIEQQYHYEIRTYDNSINANQSTSSNEGSLGNASIMPEEVPLNNLIAGTQFTNFFNADSLFEFNSYPARTTVKIEYYCGNQICYSSFIGTLVGPNKVLTMLSLSFETNVTSFDSAFVKIPSSNLNEKYRVNKIIHRNDVDSSLNYFTVLELDEPIGNELGWLGIAIINDYETRLDKLYYKFSYPDSLTYNDLPANGDTLKFNYGKMDTCSRLYLYLFEGDINTGGVHGGSMFYKENNTYSIIGISTWRSGYIHSIFSRSDYFLFKEIIESNVLNTINNGKCNDEITIFPNPTSGTLNISPPSCKSLIEYEISNYMGQILIRDYVKTKDITTLNLNDYDPGIYFISMQDENSNKSIQKFIITD
jgi:hypothetical protein